MVYEVPEGSKGMLLLVPVSTTANPLCIEQNSIVDYINNYSYLKFRGMNLDLSSSQKRKS